MPNCNCVVRRRLPSRALYPSPSNTAAAEEVIEHRSAIFARYLERWAPAQKWKCRNRGRAANAFVGMLRASLFEDVLNGLRSVSEAEIRTQAQWAAKNMLSLLKAGSLD